MEEIRDKVSCCLCHVMYVYMIWVGLSPSVFFVDITH